MATEADELVAFLDSPRSDVRNMAFKIVSGLTASMDGIEQLAALSSTLLPILLRRMADDSGSSDLALTTLINLSQDPNLAAQLVDLKAVSRSMDLLRDQPGDRERLLIMLLSNLTVQEDAAEELLQVGSGVCEGFNFGCTAVPLQWATRAVPMTMWPLC
eukprot:jgi/Botrbrau1/12477/Bobra.0169s0024.1